MFFITKSALIFFIILNLLMAKSALAGVTLYTDRATFEAQLDTNNIVIDDYENPGYTSGDIVHVDTEIEKRDGFSDAAMSAVLGETKYIVTNPVFYNLVYVNFVVDPGNRFYCTGCNGTFTLDFTSTSFGDSTGVFGAGFYVGFSRRSVNPYQPAIATVTFGDDSTQDYILTTQSFFGVVAEENIKSIHVGGPGGTDVSGNFSFYMDNLIIGDLGNTPDISLRSIEVNQAIQDWENNVPLITDKKTTARVFLQTKPGLQGPLPATGKMVGRRYGQALPESPLMAINSADGMAHTDAVVERAVLGSSLNFVLPTTWLDGTVELEFVPDGDPIRCEEPAGELSNGLGDVPGDCRVIVEFIPALEPKINFIAVGTSRGTPTTKQMFEQMQRVRSIFPVANIDYQLDQMITPFDVDSIHITPSLSLTTPSRWLVIINQALTLKRYYDTNNSTTGNPPLYYGALIGGDGGLASGIPGVVSSGYMESGDMYAAGALQAGKYARNRGAHELAHTLGTSHAVDGALGITTEDGVDWKRGICSEWAIASAPDHPFRAVLDVPSIFGGTKDVFTIGPLSEGVNREIWGLDNRYIQLSTFFQEFNLAVVNPRDTFELMSYCMFRMGGTGNVTFLGGPQGRWIGQTNYFKLQEVFTPASALANAPMTTLGAGDYLIVRGTINTSADTVSFGPTLSFTGNPPANETGGYRIRLFDKSNSELASVNFEPVMLEQDLSVDLEPEASKFALLTVAVPKPSEAVARIELERSGEMLGSITASSNAPSLVIVAPRPGEKFKGEEITFEWSGFDADGDELSYTVRYSDDDGLSWETVAVDLVDSVLTVPRGYVSGSGLARLEVIASDGLNTASAISERFSVMNNLPVIQISTPTVGVILSEAQRLSLEATAYDTEDELLDDQIRWDSDLDGYLGTGAVLTINVSSLSDGMHVLTASVMDNEGGQNTDTVTVFKLHDVVYVLKEAIGICHVPHNQQNGKVLIPGTPADSYDHLGHGDCPLPSDSGKNDSCSCG